LSWSARFESCVVAVLICSEALAACCVTSLTLMIAGGLLLRAREPRAGEMPGPPWPDPHETFLKEALPRKRRGPEIDGARHAGPARVGPMTARPPVWYSATDVCASREVTRENRTTGARAAGVP
jgi:hypothetical protein